MSNEEDVKTLVSKMYNIQEISEYHKEIIVKYFKYMRHQNELHLKEIDNAFKQISNSRLLENTYTLEEVSDIVKSIQTVLNSTSKTESQNVMFKNVELLRQIFKEADSCGLEFKLDVSSIESEEAVDKISQLEQTLFKSNNKLLPSLGKASLLSHEEVLTMQEENKALKEKLSKIQQNYTTVLKDKTNLNDQVTQLKVKLQQAKDERKKEATTTGADEELVEFKEQLEKSLKASRDEAESLKFQLQESKKEMQNLQKELLSKVSETSQFKNMKKILQTRNEQLKKLRSRLGSEEESEDEDSQQ